MPVVPPVNLDPHENAYLVLNAVRARLNDKLPTLQAYSGKILEETQATTQQMFNSAYRRFQNELMDSGLEKFADETVIYKVPTVTNFDPASQCWMSFTQFFDGTNYQSYPVLPANLLIPLWMSERQNGVNLPFPPVNRPNMINALDGMTGTGKWIRNRYWEWRNETLYFPGATMLPDFRLRYRAYRYILNDVGSQPWFMQPIQILGSSDALAWWMCFEFATARMADGDASEMMANVQSVFKAEAQAATSLVVNQTVMKNERTNVRQIPYGGNRSGLFYGW